MRALLRVLMVVPVVLAPGCSDDVDGEKADAAKETAVDSGLTQMDGHAAGDASETTDTDGGNGHEDASETTDTDGGNGHEDASETTDTDGGDGHDMVFDLSVELDYSDDALWMCKPGIVDNACEVDLDATVILPDGSVGEVEIHEINSDANFDCFYVYPTADLTFEAGNVTDLSANTGAKNYAAEQAARFNSLCRVFAPYYRQMTIGSYTDSPPEKYEEVFENAYRDLINAFTYYMEHDNQGRDIVLMGHSQGSHMLTRLLQEQFDDVAEMREKLISALLIGTSDIYVPHGETVGASFQNLPICTAIDQTGCIVSCNLIAAPVESVLSPGGLHTAGPPPENDVICVHPGAPDGGKAPLRSVYSLALDESISTPYVVYRDLYTAECIGEGKARGLLIEADPDSDFRPLDFEAIANLFFGSEASLHLIEYQLILGELLELVKSQAESR